MGHIWFLNTLRLLQEVKLEIPALLLWQSMFNFKSKNGIRSRKIQKFALIRIQTNELDIFFMIVQDYCNRF
jgi:hypothetical protein